MGRRQLRLESEQDVEQPQVDENQPEATTAADQAEATTEQPQADESQPEPAPKVVKLICKICFEAGGKEFRDNDVVDPELLGGSLQRRIENGFVAYE